LSASGLSGSLGRRTAGGRATSNTPASLRTGGGSQRRPKFTGIRSMKQSVPSRSRPTPPLATAIGSTTLVGQLPSETKCPDPPANLFPPPTFSRCFSMKQRVPSRRWSKVPRSKVQSQDCELLIFDLGPWTSSCPVPICPVPTCDRALGHEFRGSSS
jgi:hypothetical protein